MFDPRQRRFGLGFGNKVTDARWPVAGGRARDGAYYSRESQHFGFLREVSRHHRHDRSRRARVQRIIQANGDDFPDFCIMAFGKRLADED